MNSTEMRVPRTLGFPPSTAASLTIQPSMPRSIAPGAGADTLAFVCPSDCWEEAHPGSRDKDRQESTFHPYLRVALLVPS